MAKQKKSNGGKSFLLGAALGAVAGGIAGILSAPKSGKETRADIKKQGEKVVKKAKTTAAKAKKTANQQIKKVKRSVTPKTTKTKK